MRIPTHSGPMQQVTYLILHSAGPDPPLAHPLDPPPWLHLIYNTEICNMWRACNLTSVSPYLTGPVD
jgi:hypothetical protein